MHRHAAPRLAQPRPARSRLAAPAESSPSPEKNKKTADVSEHASGLKSADSIFSRSVVLAHDGINLSYKILGVNRYLPPPTGSTKYRYCPTAAVPSIVSTGTPLIAITPDANCSA